MLKVGDKVTVKLTGPWKNEDAKHVAGKTGTIKIVESRFPNYDYRVIFDNLSYTWWIADDDIEKGVTIEKKPTLLPVDAKERKNIPIVTGVLDYFTAALADVARASKAGNDQHNPGQPLHWARKKSSDHADCIGRHLSERGTIDVDGQRHSAKLAWRALALLQEELEAEGAPVARGASYDEEKK